nr:immunoglobulin heavy chain junction region [Macaca mulatta]
CARGYSYDSGFSSALFDYW